MFNGDKIKIMLFGESHGECVGVCVEGLPHGIEIDTGRVKEFAKRRIGVAGLTTARREADEVEIISGVFNGKTTGGAVCAVIKNEDARSKDYNQNIPRPSHADYTARGRYEEFNDYRGGGMFSGRLTAPLAFIGAVADSILETKGITTGSHVLSIHNVCDKPLDMVNINAETLKELNAKEIPVLDETKGEEMKQAVLKAKADGDSVGGVLECAAVGVPAFFGGNYFGRLNSKIASLVFSVPAFCALEIGAGFEAAKRKGSENNDGFRIENGKVTTITNNSGGINGGITNGMPVIICCGVKPTPSIYIPQQTIDMKKMCNTEYTIQGRHDPCIALRAGVVLQSMLNIALLDTLI